MQTGLLNPLTLHGPRVFMSAPVSGYPRYPRTRYDPTRGVITDRVSPQAERVYIAPRSMSFPHCCILLMR